MVESQSRRRKAHLQPRGAESLFLNVRRTSLRDTNNADGHFSPVPILIDPFARPGAVAVRVIGPVPGVALRMATHRP